MRPVVFFLIAGIFSLPCAASAQAPAGLDALCKNYTGNPSGQQSFDASGAAEVMDTFLKRKVLCPSACFDVSLTLSIENQKLKIVTTAVDKCTEPKTDQSKIKNVFSPLEKPNASRNCNAGKGLPSITAITKKLDPAVSGVPGFASSMVPAVFNSPLKVGPKSRCDSNVLKVVSAFTSNGNSGLEAGLGELAGLSAPTEATPLPDIQTPAQLSQSLQDKLNVPKDVADTLSRDKSSDVAALLQKVEQKDTAGAQQLARELNLNADVQRNIASLNPGQSPDAGGAGAGSVTNPDHANTTTTFQNKSEMDRAKQAIANIESRGGLYHLRGPITNRGDRAYGKYQVMGVNVGPWTQAALGYRMTPEDFLRDPQAQERVFEHRFGGYAQKYGWEGAARAWFAGEGGMYTNRNDQLGTTVSRYASRFNGYFQSGQVLAGGSGNTGAYSPFGSITQVGQSPGSYGSAFGSVNPLYSGSGYSVSSGYSAGSYGGASSGSMFSLLSGFLGSMTSSQNQPTASQQTAVPQSQVQPVVTIIAQPSLVYVGNQVVVSWSSVGAHAGSCKMLMNEGGKTSTLSAASEGSMYVRATSTGQLRFAIVCLKTGGGQIQQLANVTVQ